MQYRLDQEISDRLELIMVTYIGNNGNTTPLKLEGNDNIFNMTYQNNKDKSLTKVNISMSALVLKVR